MGIERQTQEIIKDGLINLFGRATESGLDLRVYGSSIKGPTFATDLTKADLIKLKQDLEALAKKERVEVPVPVVSNFDNKGTLKFTRSLWPGHIKGVVEDEESSKAIITFTIGAPRLTNLVNMGLG